MHSQWTFVSNHALVLGVLNEHDSARQRDIARMIGITQGAVQRILHDLVEGGYVTVERIGRRNRYRINDEVAMRHPTLADRPVAALLASVCVRDRPGDEAAEQNADERAPGATGKGQAA